MIIKKKILLLLVLSSMLFSTSCGTIDTTDSSCSKMSNLSSLPINELLNSSEILKIDNKDFKLKVTSNNVLSQYLSRFPSNLFPKFENNCSKDVNGFIYSTDNTMSGLPTYQLERIWFINSQKQVWETSRLGFNNNAINNISNNFSIQELAPNWKEEGIRSVNVVLKFKYNNISYFIKSIL